MKKLLVLVILATFLILVLPACGSSNTATADQATPRPTVDLPTPDQLPNKAPSRDGNLEKNDDPGPGPYWGNN